MLFQGERLTPFAICIYCGTLYGCGHLFLILWLSEHLSVEVRREIRSIETILYHFQSVQLAESIYFSNWYELKVEQQKMLLFMLRRAQNPFVLSCGSLCSASLSTFMKVRTKVLWKLVVYPIILTYEKIFYTVKLNRKSSTVSLWKCFISFSLFSDHEEHIHHAQCHSKHSKMN